MKKIFTLFSLMVMLAFNAQAAFYLVGQEPFGTGWSPNAGVEMTLNTDGTYSYTATINGTIWFVFTDQFAEPNDWTTFNNTYRIGPTGGDETVVVDTWTTTQRSGGDHGAYKFTGSGNAYTITINPYIWKFKIEGDVVIPEGNEFTVAGAPESVFGTEWDINNADNLMDSIENNTYELVKTNCELAVGNEILFKVVKNHDWGFAWPGENMVVPIEQSGVYDIKFIFNYDPEDEANSTVSYELTFKESIPDPDPTGELYVIGEVNGNSWDPSVGYQMDTEDQRVFTGQITLAGENIDEVDGIGYSFFSFTTKLGENSEDWSGISAYRIGSIEDGYLLSDDQLGIEVALAGLGSNGSFKAPAGTYDVTVNLENMTMVITKEEGGIEEYITDSTKVVASMRYFNVMGQEMTEANGVTIVVTTYTDGSRSAVKIIK